MSFLAACGLFTSCDAQKITQLTPKEYAHAIQKDSTAVILDVRTADEFAQGHLEKAVSLNVLNASAFDAGLTKLDKTKTYYVYCRSGRRSYMAASKMQKQGFRVLEMKGGIQAWLSESMPVVK